MTKGLLAIITLLSLSSCDINIFFTGSESSSESNSPSDYESSTFVSSDDLSVSDSDSDISSEVSNSSESISSSDSSEIVDVDVTDKTASVRVCLNVKTTFQITAIGTIFDEDIFDTRRHFTTQHDTV